MKEGRRRSSTSNRRVGSRHGTLLRIMCVDVEWLMGTATLVVGPGQSYVVDLLLRRIEETFRSGRLRREWNGRSAGAAGAGRVAGALVLCVL